MCVEVKFEFSCLGDLEVCGGSYPAAARVYKVRHATPFKDKRRLWLSRPLKSRSGVRVLREA